MQTRAVATIAITFAAVALAATYACHTSRPWGDELRVGVGHSQLILASFDGRLFCIVVRTSDPRSFHGSIIRNELDQGSRSIWTNQEWFGLGIVWSRLHHRHGRVLAKYRGAAVPHKWLIGGCCMVACIAARSAWQRHRRALAGCAACGYDACHVPDVQVCPECGAVVTPPALRAGR